MGRTTISRSRFEHIAAAALLVLGLFGGLVACDDAPPKEVIIAVGGMTCNSCVNAIAGELRKVKGVIDVEVSLKAARARVRYAPDKVAPSVFVEAIRRLGYEPKLQP